jgi:4-carboxymuconolactone decarboxylase
MTHIWRVIRIRLTHRTESGLMTHLPVAFEPARLGQYPPVADRGSNSAIPLGQLPPDVASTVADAGVKQVNLYRSLSHAPDLLRAWIDFAWALRGHDTTSRRLRELCILRTASLHHSQYEWHQHRRMAREVGVTDYQVAELEMWRTSDAFDAEERAALALTDAIIAGDVADEIITELERHFDHAQRVELTVTAAFYAMVPRILEALRVPVEGKEPDRDLPKPPPETTSPPDN